MIFVFDVLLHRKTTGDEKARFDDLGSVKGNKELARIRQESDSYTKHRIPHCKGGVRLLLLSLDIGPLNILSKM